VVHLPLLSMSRAEIGGSRGPRVEDNHRQALAFLAAMPAGGGGALCYQSRAEAGVLKP
jgi:hypothetical protein